MGLAFAIVVLIILLVFGMQYAFEVAQPNSSGNVALQLVTGGMSLAAWLFECVAPV